MPSPGSSRSVDPTLAAKTGVLRDAVGAVHNLQHLLGSSRVGPKALLRVIPDVRASCRPAMDAASDLAQSAARIAADGGSIDALGNLLRARLEDVESSLVDVKRFGASERLSLEGAVGRAVKDLDASLELADLLVEASAASGVMLDARDVLRESTTRSDTGSGRGRRVPVVLSECDEAVLVEANPRFAVRLLAFVVALVAGPEDGAHVTVKRGSSACIFEVSWLPAGKIGSGAVPMLVPPVIGLSGRVVAGAARIARASVDMSPDGRSASLSVPLLPVE